MLLFSFVLKSTLLMQLVVRWRITRKGIGDTLLLVLGSHYITSLIYIL